MSQLITPEKSAIDEAVKATKAIFLDVRRRALSAYWEIGKAADSLETDYGESTIKQFAVRLRQELTDELSESTVYRARQFFRRTSEDQLKVMLTSNISWGQVVPTLSADNEVVQEVLDKLQDSEISPSRFASEVKRAQEETQRTSDEGEADDEAQTPAVEGDTFDAKPEVDKTFKFSLSKLVRSLEEATNCLADVLILVDQFYNLNEASQKLYKKQIDDVLLQLKINNESCQNVQKTINDRYRTNEGSNP